MNNRDARQGDEYVDVLRGLLGSIKSSLNAGPAREGPQVVYGHHSVQPSSWGGWSGVSAAGAGAGYNHMPPPVLPMRGGQHVVDGLAVPRLPSGGGVPENFAPRGSGLSTDEFNNRIRAKVRAQGDIPVVVEPMKLKKAPPKRRAKPAKCDRGINKRIRERLKASGASGASGALKKEPCVGGPTLGGPSASLVAGVGKTPSKSSLVTETVASIARALVGLSGVTSASGNEASLPSEQWNPHRPDDNQ